LEPPPPPQIVANATNGVDVDKFDYLRRDSYMTGVGSGCYDFGPLLQSARVVNGVVGFKGGSEPVLNRGWPAAWGCRRAREGVCGVWRAGVVQPAG
jgi:hypothetical protein